MYNIKVTFAYKLIYFNVSSMESLNMLSRREKVLKNTFESLSGAEMDKELTPKGNLFLFYLTKLY